MKKLLALLLALLALCAVAAAEVPAGSAREDAARIEAAPPDADFADALGKLDAPRNAADPGRGGDNCPSPCFLTMEYEDGSTASLAVATNAFDYFFYRGPGIQTGADIRGIFGLSYEDF